MSKTARSIAVCLAFTLAACSSAEKRAGEYMEKGLYDDAIRTYQGILSKNPNDADAAVGLKKAEAAWIDHRLIDVRMTRLAGSGDQALGILLDIENREAQWGTEAMGNVAFTQNEETSYGIAFADKYAADAAAEKLPLKAEVFLLKYAKIFTGSDVARRFDAVRARNKAAGKASCERLLPAGARRAALAEELALRHPYYYEFLRTYCDYWGEESPEPSVAAGKYVKSYVGKFQASAVGVTNLPADIRVFLADAAKTAFEKTAWFDSEGEQSVNLNVSGSYTLFETRQPQALQFVYTEQVPYTVYVDVERTRDVPYSDTDLVYDPVSKLNKPIAVTKYRAETYTVSEPQTRYRDVQRVYPYQGFEHDRKITVGLSSQLALATHPIQLELSDVSQTGGIEHDESQPAIGLAPEHPNLQDPPAWLKLESSRFVAQFAQKLSDLWKDSYCQGSGAEDVAISGDLVEKCLRQKVPQAPAFADTWYERNFGVSAAEATGILGDEK